VGAAGTTTGAVGAGKTDQDHAGSDTESNGKARDAASAEVQTPCRTAADDRRNARVIKPAPARTRTDLPINARAIAPHRRSSGVNMVFMVNVLPSVPGR
jgi:hypothetical protein